MFCRLGLDLHCDNFLRPLGWVIEKLVALARYPSRLKGSKVWSLLAAVAKVRNTELEVLKLHSHYHKYGTKMQVRACAPSCSSMLEEAIVCNVSKYIPRGLVCIAISCLRTFSLNNSQSVHKIIVKFFKNLSSLDIKHLLNKVTDLILCHVSVLVV